MEGVKSFWVINKSYSDVREFHFTSDIVSFVVFFKNEEIAFVLDNTCDIVSPNNLLIIEPLKEDIGNKKPNTKWDSILKNKFGINPINIRPKENTKYKKLDISYAKLDLYASFSSLQNQETLDLIMQNREILSLENAYEREAENLLQYNKSTQTIQKASVTLENLKKKILNISKRLKKQKELEEKNPDKVDEALKSELVKKLYDNTEKLKRTERRIKRAKKRSESAFEDLSLKRVQIQEIKRRLEERGENYTDIKDNKEILSSENEVDSVISNNYILEKNEAIQNITNGKIENLTTENINATNETGEGVGTILQEKETTMVKDTENKNVKNSAEFKPPFVDDTENQEVKSSDIRFAQKTELLDDKYKKIWLYVGSVIASLVVVFGLFFLLSSGESTEYPVNEDVYNTNYIEQNYQETPQPYVSPENIVDEQPSEEVAPVVEEPVVVDEPIVEENIVIEEQPVIVPEPKTEYKKPAPAPVKPISKKTTEKKVEKEVVVETKKEEPVVISETPEESYVEEESEIVEYYDEVEPEEDYTEEVYEEDYIEDESFEDTSLLDESREEYINTVLKDSKYLTLLEEVKNEFFTLDDISKIKEIEKMNRYWNDFRNATYEAYYETDYTLKPDIDYEKYANDEYLLRLYTNAYFDFFEYIVNEFVMTYEYANSTAVDLYTPIEEELQILGRPLTKLILLSKVYNAVQNAGGPSAVLLAIIEKDEVENELADNMEIEASLVPLTATTEIVYQQEILDNQGDIDIVSEETTTITRDLADEYEESPEILTYSSEELVNDNLEEANEIVYYPEDIIEVEEIDAGIEEEEFVEPSEDVISIVIDDEEEIASMPDNDEYYDNEEYYDDTEYYDDEDIEYSDNSSDQEEVL